jgi:nucleoside-diphosphate-sugar epimerase
MSNTAKGRVCVTGASGFIGYYVVRELLERGYHVVATVRDASNEAKTAHLHKMHQSIGGEMSLVSADLEVDGAFDEAIAGCDFVCHVASSVRLRADDPQKEIVDVALNGTKNVLESVAKAGTVRRLVVTSSIAAVADENRPKGHEYTEADWNESANLKESPYPLSKTLAEKAAWDFIEALPEDQRFEMTTIQPSLVLGPITAEVHLRTSPSVIHNLMDRSFPACPDLYFNVVDVRDVARAHVNALEVNNPSRRYICSYQEKSMRELAVALKECFPQRPIPTGHLPAWLMYIFAIFDKRLSWSYLRKSLGRKRLFSNRLIREELDIDFADLTTTLRDTGQAMIDLNTLKK